MLITIVNLEGRRQSFMLDECGGVDEGNDGLAILKTDKGDIRTSEQFYIVNDRLDHLCKLVMDIEDETI